MKNILKKGKVIIFFLALIVIWVTTENILQTPKSSDWNTKTAEKIKEKSNYYDVIIVGTSMAVTNISAEELYLKYGIAAVSIGKPQQMAYLSYYELEDTLNYQTPKAVIFDVQSMFYTEDTQKEWISQNEEYHAHYTIDDIKNVKTKYEAVKQLKELSEKSTYWDYFSKMYHNHSNWEDINEQNFKSQQGNDIILGNRSLIGCYENITENKYISGEANTDPKVEIPEINRKYLEKMNELCKEKNIDLLLVRSCGSLNWSWEQYNAIVELATEMNIDYIDLALSEEQIGFDWNTDSYDGNHHNVIGTQKWTDFIGEYLSKQYEFADKRTDKKYQEFETLKEQYENRLNAMTSEIELVSAVNLNQYLDTLLNMEKKDSAIFISVNDEASINFSTQNYGFFNLLGLNINLMGKYRYSYCAVLDDGKNIAEECDKDKVELKGSLIDNTEYETTSGGLLSGQNASIKINGVEQIQNGRGINIVVYNKNVKEVLSSVYFDTFEEENPITARMIDGERQTEVGVNIWK